MLKKMVEGLRGYNLWKKITKEYDLNRDNFFFIYPGEEHLVQYVNKYLYSYMYEYKAVRCIFITLDQTSKEIILNFFKGNSNIDVIVITEKEANRLLMAYWFQALGDKVMVISLKNLYGRKLGNLVGINDIAEEELMIAALFNLKAKKVGKECEDKIKWTFRVRA